MKHFACPLLAASSVACWAALAMAATRPHYGGSLRVDMAARMTSIDPTEWPSAGEAAALMEIRAMIFDRLVRLDGNGRPQPALALGWEHEPQSRTWRFKLRPGVTWQNGSSLTSQDILASLGGLGAEARIVGDALEIKTKEPESDLLTPLATDPEAVVRRPAIPASDALPIGTGPFRLITWQPGRLAVLEANDHYWGGRPYLDRIEIQMGRSSRDQLLDLELDRADVVELEPSEARRAQQEGKKVWTSLAVDLLCLRFDLGKPAVQDRRRRQAVADSIDRAAIQKVLLQNYGDATASLLPRWVSGYAFLFPTTLDPATVQRVAGTPPTLKLGYEAHDVVARQTAERIAVNARDVGVTMQVAPLPFGWRSMPDAGADLRVERVRVDVPSLDLAFRQAAAALGLPGNDAPEDAEHIYDDERKLLGELSVVPLVYAPDLIGLGSRVKDWSPLPWGLWQLDHVWLQAAKP